MITFLSKKRFLTLSVISFAGILIFLLGLGTIIFSETTLRFIEKDFIENIKIFIIPVIIIVFFYVFFFIYLNTYKENNENIY